MLSDCPGAICSSPLMRPPDKGKPWKKRGAEKPAISLKPGEVVVGRRLYRSGQSEYLINGRVARLRDVQEIFMGMGLGPDSYAIIEQGRIGQILNSKPMDRRAIIEEAAGITMYKTKRRLAEAKLEASKLNLSRVQRHSGGSGKAARFAEAAGIQGAALRGTARADARAAAQRAGEQGGAPGYRSGAAGEVAARNGRRGRAREARSVHELEAEQERLSARTYELDAELRQNQNLLGQTALDLDRAENRITFNREQAAQIDARAARLAMEIEQAERQAARDVHAHGGAARSRRGAARANAALEAALRETTEQASRALTRAATARSAH